MDYPDLRIITIWIDLYHTIVFPLQLNYLHIAAHKAQILYQNSYRIKGLTREFFFVSSAYFVKQINNFIFIAQTHLSLA